MTGENLPGIPPSKIELPTFQEAEGTVPPSEIKRLGANWQRTLNLVWRVNEPLLEKNYATDERIKADLGVTDTSDQKFKDEKAKRIHDQQTAQTTTDRDTIALQLIKEDPRFERNNITDDVVQEEVTKEIERREGLLKAKNALYDAEDEVNGIKAVAEREVDNAFEEAKDKRLKELTEEARKADANAPEVTSLQPDEEAKLKEDARAKVIPLYYDADQGIYYQLKEGKPDITDPISTPEAYEPVYEELKRIEGLIDADGHPTPEALEAQTLRKTLIYNPDPEKQGFRVLTEEEIIRREIDGDGEQIMLEAKKILSKKVEGLGDYNDLFIRENGEIKDVDTKKLEKMLEKLPPDGEIGHFLLLMRAYRDTRIPQAKQDTILSLLYHSVKKVNPDMAKNLKNGSYFDTTLTTNVYNTLITNFKVNPGLLADLPYDRLMDILQTARLIQDRQGFIVANGDRFALSPKVRESLFARPGGLTPRDEELIVHFARYEGSAETFFQSVLGIDANYLTDNTAFAGYLQEAVNEVVATKSPNEQKVYRRILEHQIGDKQLEKLAKERGFPKGMGMGLMLLLIFAPSLQKLLEDLGGADRGGQQPEGG